MKKSTIIKLGVSLVFIALLAKAVDGPKMTELLRQINPIYLGLSILLSFCMVGLSCWKWQFLLKLQGHREKTSALIRIYFIGYYFSCLLPSNVGGDVVRSIYAGRRIQSQSHAAVSVFLERFTGFILLLTLTLAAPALYPGLYRHPAVFIPVGMAVFFLLGFIGMLFLPDPVGFARRIWTFLSRSAVDQKAGLGAAGHRILDHVDSFYSKLSGALSSIGKRPSALAGVALLTLLFYAATWLNVWISFRAFDQLVDWRPIIAATPVALLVAMIPIAPLGGLGLTEGAFVFFFGLVGVDAQAALAMSLLLRFKVILIGSVGMICHITHKEKSTIDEQLRTKQSGS